MRIEPGAKQCYDEGWSDEGYTPDFGPDDSIGIHWGEYSKWRVDVEADVPEGIPILKSFLGDTLRFGRPGALGSHNVVRAVGAKTKKFKDTNGEMLIELRSTGTQSVVPPSEHEQGPRVWENGYDPTKIKEFGAGELAKTVALAAAATLIAREMPDGGRHDWCLALAGFLVPRVGDDRTYEVLDAAWEAAEAYIEGHTARELQSIVYDTAEALERDGNVTGGRTVDEATPGVVKLLSKWLDPTLYVPTEEEIMERRRKAAANAWPECEALAKKRDILSEIYAALEANGLVGEETNAALLVLSAVSTRHLEESLSMLGEGTSSSGKSEVMKRVVKTLPPEFYIERQSVSDKALAYMGEELRRRILVVYELGGLGQQGSDGLEMAKQLLTEGRISRQIAESTAKGVRGRAVEVEGPTSLWTTTTKVFTDHELNTRLFKFQPDDSQGQTRNIIASIFAEDRMDVDFARFRALHTWLEGQDNRVTIPYGNALAAKMVSSAVRLRRDATRLRNLIRAHAVLHQATRYRDARGRIVATLEDYAAVHALVDNMIGVAAEKSVSTTVRETVEKAQELIGEGDPVNAKTLKDKLGCDRTTATRRLGAAKGAGYLDHDPDQEGKAKAYVLGDPLPEAQAVLPTVEDLEREVCTCAPFSGGEGVGQVHEDSCALGSAQLGAHVHAHLGDSVPPREAKADTYQEFCVEEPTRGDVPGQVIISAHTCTHDGSEPQNSHVCTHMCKEVCTGEEPTDGASEDREEIWEWAVSLWEGETRQDPTTTAAGVIRYCKRRVRERAPHVAQEAEGARRG